jgi:Cu/Ag efflux pump CusA
VNHNGLSSEDGIAIAVIGGLIVSTALTLGPHLLPDLKDVKYRHLKEKYIHY